MLVNDPRPPEGVALIGEKIAGGGWVKIPHPRTPPVLDGQLSGTLFVEERLEDRIAHLRVCSGVRFEGIKLEKMKMLDQKEHQTMTTLRERTHEVVTFYLTPCTLHPTQYTPHPTPYSPR